MKPIGYTGERSMQDSEKLAELTPKIMNAFHDLGRQHPQGERLSMRQFQALIILNANQSLTLTQLCEKLCLAPSTGTELVERMMDLGYIQKSTGAEDHRQVKLTVAPKGGTLLKERQRRLSEMFSHFMHGFSTTDRNDFVAAFEKIWALIQKYHMSHS